MVQTLRTCRQPLTLAAIALLMSANLHCAWEWQAALNHGEMQPPLGIPGQGCENESGCICGGALVAQPVDAAILTSNSAWLMLEFPPPILVSQFEAADRDCLTDRLHCLSPPISGRQLRALYASLVI